MIIIALITTQKCVKNKYQETLKIMLTDPEIIKLFISRFD